MKNTRWRSSAYVGVAMTAMKIRGGLTPSKGVRPLLVFVVLLLSPATALAADELVSVQADFLAGEYQSVVNRTDGLLEKRDVLKRDTLLYLQGISAFKLGDLDLARASLLKLTTQYPSSPWASHAKEVLGSEDFYFSVQVGAFGTEANALRLESELRRRGYEAFVTETLVDGRRLYRVRVGRFSDRAKAEELERRLRQDRFPTKIFP